MDSFPVDLAINLQREDLCIQEVRIEIYEGSSRLRPNL